MNHLRGKELFAIAFYDIDPVLMVHRQNGHRQKGFQTKGPKNRQKDHRQKGQKSRQKGQKPKLYFNCFFNVIKRIWNLIYLKRLAYLLYGSVASLPSPSSNIEAWPYGTSLRFASLLHLGH